MWPRVVETMLGVWLVMSPFIFGHEANQTVLWLHDLGIGLVVIVLGLASYWSVTSWAHWLIIPVAAWMIVYGRFLPPAPPDPAAQNHIILGLSLLMIAILPNESSRPPAVWRDEVHHS